MPAVRTKPTKTYIFQADIVRVLAILGVVGIHVLTPIYARPDFFGGGIWWVAFLLNCILRTSVPLFIMLSGYLVMGKDVTWQENLRRLWQRILVPLIFFYCVSTFYSFWAAAVREEPYQLVDFFLNMAKNTHTPLYFLVVLAFLYALIPLFRLAFDKTHTWMPPYLMMFFFGNAIVATFVRYLALREGEVFPTFTLWLMWVGYFLYGYWIRLQGKVWSQGKLLTVVAAGYILTAIGGYFSLKGHLFGNDMFYIFGQTYPEEYLSISVVAMSVALFPLLMRVRLPRVLEKSAVFLRFLQYAASLSFGIYLIHPIVLDIINKFFGVTADSPTMPNLWAYVAINAFIGLSVSAVLTTILKKIPLLRSIIGEQ